MKVFPPSKLRTPVSLNLPSLFIIPWSRFRGVSFMITGDCRCLTMVLRRFPRGMRISNPPNKVLGFSTMYPRVQYFLHSILLHFLDDNGRRWRYDLPRQGV